MKQRLSIVIPVFNAVEHLRITLQSVVNHTDNLYEIILVDDYSDEPTRAFIDGLRLNDDLDCRLIKTRNPRHSWTNASWNMGVSLATGDYIAILNSDISVSRHWDTALIKQLDTATIACPYEKKPDGSLQKLDPVIEKVDPKMLKGACFMFQAQYKFDWLFPIPPYLTHWCGDNYLADRANRVNGVKFTEGATITHAITQSGRLIKPEEYNRVCKQDVINYQVFSGRDMSLVLKNFN
jgi:glycosyltransferase involved in cell wall biosynthesis